MKDFIVIGAGQAGMAISYYLTQHKQDFLVVDANRDIGAPWLKRWDSLRLFTVSEYNNLPDLKFPHPKGYYATKYDVANYLKAYVEKFKIPIAFNQKIKGLNIHRRKFKCDRNCDQSQWDIWSTLLKKIFY